MHAGSRGGGAKVASRRREAGPVLPEPSRTRSRASAHEGIVVEHSGRRGEVYMGGILQRAPFPEDVAKFMYDNVETIDQLEILARPG